MHSQPKQPKDWRELDPSQDSDHTWLAMQGVVLHISVCAMCIFVPCEYQCLGICFFVCNYVFYDVYFSVNNDLCIFVCAH